MQGDNARFCLAAFAGLLSGQVITTTTGMGLDIEKGFSGRSDVTEQSMQDGMLERVRMK